MKAWFKVNISRINGRLSTRGTALSYATVNEWRTREAMQFLGGLPASLNAARGRGNLLAFGHSRPL
jgi:hypothetical protein